MLMCDVCDDRELWNYVIIYAWNNKRYLFKVTDAYTIYYTISRSLYNNIILYDDDNTQVIPYIRSELMEIIIFCCITRISLSSFRTNLPNPYRCI